MTTESMKPYPAYKDSGIEWIGEIPEGWDMRKVSRSFALIGSGTTPKSNEDQYYQNGDISWIITGDLNDGLLNDSSKKITPKALEDHSTLKIYPKDTLIVAMYGATIGKICMTNFEACTNQACCALSESPYLFNRFTFYWFIANKHNIINMSYGGGQPNISQEIIRSLKITTPSLVEQHSIIIFLDNQTAKIDTLIENKQKQIELLKEERTAIINQAVTKGLNPDVPMRDSGIEWLGEIPEHWEIKKLKYLAKNINYKMNSNSYDLKIALENVESFTGNLLNLNSEDAFESEGKEFINGDVLFNKLRPYLAKVYRTESRGLCVSELLVLRPNEKIRSDFLYYRCLSTDFINEVDSSTYGSKMPRASWNFIENLLIPFTTKKEQESIIKYIESEITKANNTISQIQQQNTLLKEYRTALISEAVTGKIDVRHEKGKELI